MNAFQSCRNTSDAVPLYLPQQLYLKPIARVNVSLQLPRRTMGKTISNWEVMEKLRNLIKPEEFTVLKVTKTSLEFIRFEAEIDSRDKLQFVVERLNNKMIKLKEFTELMHLRAAEAKLDFPSRHVWDSFFRESKDMDEMKPGERPDTIHISNLPIRWFISQHLSRDDDIKPSEKMFYCVFEKFGRIRYVDIPICDPYRKQMKTNIAGMQVFSFDENDFFEGYVQFRDYAGFTKAMDAFRNMKLLRKEDGECLTVNMKVDFDRTKHLSDASIRRREIVRERLISKMREKEEKEEKEKAEKERQAQLEREKEQALKSEKEKRREEREKKRKQKILAKLKVNGTDELTNKIAKEEKKLLKVQRKLEAIRLVEELFRRIKNKCDKDVSSNRAGLNQGDNELNRYKSAYEFEVRQQRDRLHKAIEGRVILKSILSGGPRLRSRSSDSLSSESSSEKKSTKDNRLDLPVTRPNLEAAYHYPEWMRYMNEVYPNPYGVACYPPALRAPLHGYAPYPVVRGRRMLGDLPGPSRGLPYPFPRRGRGYNRGMNRKHQLYPPGYEEEYIRYFQKFMNEHDDRVRRSYTKSKSRSPKRNRSYSHSPSRRRTHSLPRRRSRSSSRRRSRSSSRRRSYSSSRRRSRSPSKWSRSSSRRRSASPSKSHRSRSPPSKVCHLRSRSTSRSHRSRSSRKSPTSHTPVRRRSGSKHKNPRADRPASKRHSRAKSGERRRSKARSGNGSKSPRKNSKSRSKSKGKERSNSVDSSKFISPRSMRKMRSRSRSWSAPKEVENGKRARRWSLSPSNKD